MSRRHVPPAVREAAIHDYYANPDTTAADIAARYGIARSTFSGWVTGTRDDIAYVGGWEIRGGIRHPLAPERRTA